MSNLPSLGDTISRLAAQRKTLGAVDLPAGTAGHTPLVPAPKPAKNPGALDGWAFVPGDLPAKAPLVVVLHGCTQNAAVYDRGSGWSALAADAGFALLYPEQTRANNPNLCFNWFVPGDIKRGHGEVESIRQMIAAMVAAHDLDPARVFVTGLSAGGAMTASMLATAPEMFAGGAIIAGIAHGTAGTMNEALDRMRGNALPDEAATAAIVRAASRHAGPWPRLSVWHGIADTTVDAANAAAIAAGWARLNGVGAPTVDELGGQRRETWRDADGNAVVESITIAGMGHGLPITAHGPEACGKPGPHMLEVGISSTRHIAAFWGIAPAIAARGVAEPVSARRGAAPNDTSRGAATTDTSRGAAPAASETGVTQIINSALRQAGLLR